MFIEYIHKKVEELKKEEMQLQNALKQDEANLVKVKVNIYEICKTIYNMAKKAPDGQEPKEFYMQRMERLHSEWKASYEKAKQFEDVEKVVIEEIKLGVLEEMNQKFLELC